MKSTLLTSAALLVRWASAMPQEPPQAPQPISTSLFTVFVTGPQPLPAPTEPVPNLPVPVPAPPVSPASSALLSSIPLPNPSAPPVPFPSAPAQPPSPSTGANCVCGATYCGKVLMGWQGYDESELQNGYCSTPGADCAGSAPPASVSLDDTLFVCICNPGQKEGTVIELLCPCQGFCRNDEPDFIGRCETPCNLGCVGGGGGGSGGALPTSPLETIVSAGAAPAPPSLAPAPAPAPVSVSPPSNAKARRH